MPPARSTLAWVLVVAACGSAEIGGGDKVDAAPALADASAGTPDASRVIDARPADASPGAPDGAILTCHVNVQIPAGCTQSSCRQIERQRDSTSCIYQGYLEYTPPGYGDGTLRPLMLFFHGIGENGNGTDELDKVASGGPPALAKNNAWPPGREFVVLSPQHFARPNTDCHSPAEIHAMIDYALQAYDVDPKRIYLTGLSCGGIGIWNYIGTHVDDQGVAAMVPIAGDGRGAWNSKGCQLGRVPIWAFHNDMDPTVSSQGTIVPVTNLTTMCDPVPDVQMIIYPSNQHDSWTKTYDLTAGHDIYAWMLQHHR
jgi:predicted peptidase